MKSKITIKDLKVSKDYKPMVSEFILGSVYLGKIGWGQGQRAQHLFLVRD